MLFFILQSFLEMVETQFNVKVKCLRSDNAFELGSSYEHATYLKNKGIIHQTICPHASTKRCCQKDTLTSPKNCKSLAFSVKNFL